MASSWDHAQFSSKERLRNCKKSSVFATYELWTVCSVECVNIVEISTVNTLRRFEPHVVVARIVVLPECSHWHVEQWAGFLTQCLNEFVLARKKESPY